MKITLKNATPSNFVMRKMGLEAKRIGLPSIILEPWRKARKP